MDWALPKDINNYGEDIDIHAMGLPRLAKMPGYKAKGLPKKVVLKLIVNNVRKEKWHVKEDKK